jgi:streptomycin 6-kinase
MMSSRTFRLSEPVRLKAQDQGEPGARWIAGLGECVEYLELNWAIRVGETMTGGSESLVATARCSDGTPAVLKIGLPGSADLAKEAEVFRLAAGRGYARLIARDDSRNALLLERLDRPLADLNLPVREQIALICATLQEAWIPVDYATGLMTGAEKARWLATFISDTWRTLDAPCDKRTRDQALSYAEEREAAFSAGRCVLVHGDAHSYNALTLPKCHSDEATRCKFVDPDGLLAEPAYDLAIPMRDWSNELLSGNALRLGRARCTFLSELTGVDERAIWQWGFIERVSTGLLLMKLGMEQAGSETLAVADRWAGG